MNPCPYQSISIIEVIEDIPVDNSIRQQICELLNNHLSGFNSDESTSVEELEFFREITLANIPTSDNMKKGYFGESLTTMLIQDFGGYTVPVSKINFRITPNQSTPGTDVIGFKISNESIEGICFVESKLRTEHDNQAGVEAYKQLKRDYDKGHSQLLYFILKVLHNRNDPIFNLLFQYMQEQHSSKENEVFFISLVYDNVVWRYDILTDLDNTIDNNYPKTSVFTTRIGNLSNLVETAYDDLRRLKL